MDRLPYEILEKILSYLDDQSDLDRVSQVSQGLNECIVARFWTPSLAKQARQDYNLQQKLLEHGLDLLQDGASSSGLNLDLVRNFHQQFKHVMNDHWTLQSPSQRSALIKQWTPELFVE